MRETVGQATVVVYPIRVGKKADRESAEHLVSLLNERKLCRARVTDEPPRLAILTRPVTSDESTMYTTSPGRPLGLPVSRCPVVSERCVQCPRSRR